MDNGAAAPANVTQGILGMLAELPGTGDRGRLAASGCEPVRLGPEPRCTKICKRKCDIATKLGHTCLAHTQEGE
jgi:hypothetical protein